MARDGFKIFDSDTHVGPSMNILDRYLATAEKARLMRHYDPAVRHVDVTAPVSISITLGEQARPLLGRDASSNGYWLVDTSYSTQNGHPVPLVGGMTAAEVGFIPMVGGGGGGGGGSITYFGQILTAAYSITDASGKILEERSFPLCPLLNASFFVGRRLEDYHDVGVYIAKRVAKVR